MMIMVMEPMFQELLQVPVLLLMDVTVGWHREQRYMR